GHLGRVSGARAARRIGIDRLAPAAGQRQREGRRGKGGGGRGAHHQRAGVVEPVPDVSLEPVVPLVLLSVVVPVLSLAAPVVPVVVSVLLPMPVVPEAP